MMAAEVQERLGSKDPEDDHLSNNWDMLCQCGKINSDVLGMCFQIFMLLSSYTFSVVEMVC